MQVKAGYFTSSSSHQVEIDRIQKTNIGPVGHGEMFRDGVRCGFIRLPDEPLLSDNRTNADADRPDSDAE
jgi:hypothetical protein